MCRRVRKTIVEGTGDLQVAGNYYVRLVSQPTSQQYCSLILNQHQPPATSQLIVLFSHKKSAPTTSHSQVNTTNKNLEQSRLLLLGARHVCSVVAEGSSPTRLLSQKVPFVTHHSISGRKRRRKVARFLSCCRKSGILSRFHIFFILLKIQIR